MATIDSAFAVFERNAERRDKIRTFLKVVEMMLIDMPVTRKYASPSMEEKVATIEKWALRDE